MINTAPLNRPFETCQSLTPDPALKRRAVVDASHLRLGGESATALAGDFVAGWIGVVLLVCHTASGIEGGE